MRNHVASVVDNNEGQTVGSTRVTDGVTVVVPSNVLGRVEGLLTRPLHSVDHLSRAVEVANQIVVTLNYKQLKTCLKGCDLDPKTGAKTTRK